MEKKISRKILEKLAASLLALTMIISGVCFLNKDGNEVIAADSTETNVSFIKEQKNLGAYRSESDEVPHTYPKPSTSGYEDWIFAGWYADEACTTPYTEETIVGKGSAYAKYVSPEILSAKCQVTAGTDEDSDKTNMRFVSTVDSGNYNEVGFEITCNNKRLTFPTTTVFKRIQSAFDGLDCGFSPVVFDTESEYFMTFTITNIANKNFDRVHFVRPYWVTMDGTTVYGMARNARVSDSYNQIANIPVRLYSDATLAAGSLQVAYDSSVFEYVGYEVGNVDANATAEKSDGNTYITCNLSQSVAKPDGMLVNLRFEIIGDVTTNTTFTVTNQGVKDANEALVSIPSVIHKTYNVSYDGTNADTSWYDEFKNNTNQKEFVIATAADLYGLASLVNAGNTFAGKTIYVGADITVNSGTDTSAFTHKDWPCIGNANDGTKYFMGVFDGNGHTISGLYAKRTIQYTGLFGKIQAAELKNFSLKNSYFESGTNFVGSVVGSGYGKMEKIYSNATLLNTAGSNTGGIIGDIRGGGSYITTVNECWFDGNVTVSSTTVYSAGGIVGKQQNGSLEISHCLNSGSVTNAGKRAGGMIGDVTSAITISDCLNTGIISASSDVGSAVGYANATVTVTNVNAINDDSMVVSGSQNISGTISSFVKNDIKGFDGYATTLDFATYWSARKSDVPVPSCFGETELIQPDASWAENTTTDEATGKTVYTISDVADLYAFVQESQTNDFANAIVKLDANITVNSGNAKSWEKNAPEYDWIPIGQTTAFAGEFDGQGYTISGLYASETTGNVGAFGKVSGATISDVKIEKSYFASTGANVGGIAGYGNGTFEKVYCNAIVVTNGGSNVGGILGVARDGASSLTECWFDGAVDVKAFVSNSYGYDAGGIVGKQQFCDLSINHCLSSGSVTSVGQRAGGFIGRIEANASSTSKLTVRDSLNLSNVTGINQIGTILGSQASAGVTKDLGENSTYGISVAEHNGIGVLATANELKGTGAYDTGLDLYADETAPYWTARQNNTPVLSYFAEGGLYAPSITWFDNGETDEETGKTLYGISDASDLYGLALLSETNTFANCIVRMEQNITVNETGSTKWEWIPISATLSQAFQGIFDGQGYTINGIHAEGSSYVALFGYAHPYSTIEDFRLEDSSFHGSAGYVASIAGQGNGTISNVYSKANVGGSVGSLGGLVAQINGNYYNLNSNRKISNCWFDGKVVLNDSSGYNVGGLVGLISGDASLNNTIEHCMFTGTVTNDVSTLHGGRVAGFVGGFNGAPTTITDCISAGTIVNKGTITGSYVGYSGNANTLTLNNVYAVTESCQSGTTHMAVASAANVNVTALSKTDMQGEAGYQNVILPYDRPETEDVEEGNWIVRKNDVPALKVFAKADDIYDITGLHRADTTWYNVPSYTEEDGTNVYVINTIEELMGVSALVSEDNTFEGEKIVLNADVTMYTGDYTTWGTTAPGASWTPIGKGSNSGATAPFAGTFDGQNHTISGIYCSTTSAGTGLFGYLYPGGTLKNFKLVNSYIKSTADCLGSIVGYGNGTIENVYSNAYVSGANNCGGLVGMINDHYYNSIKIDRVLSNCWYEGNVTATGIHVGGLVGQVQATGYSLTIAHCLNSAAVTTSNTQYGRVGGFVGNVQGNANVAISDSLNVGTITGTNSGAAVGRIDSSTVDLGTDSTYMLSTSATKAIGTETDTAMVSCTLEQLTGYNACNNTGLDFYLDNDDVAYWTVRSDGTPILTSFAEEGLYVLDTSWYGDGSATTYTLDSVEDMYGFAMLSTRDNFEGDTIEVASGVEALVVNEEEASTYTDKNPRYDWIPIGGLNNAKPFKGNFHGNGVTISGLYCNVTTNHTGLFTGTNGCTIQDFRLVNSYFATTKNYAGSITSYAIGITLSDVYSDAIVKCDGTLMGGMIGNVDGNGTTTTVAECWFDGTVNDTVPTSDSNYSSAGGVVGKVAVNVTLTMTNSLNSGKVVGAKRVGGLVGDSNYNATLTFTNCMNTGEVDGAHTVYTTVNKKSATDETEAVEASIGATGYPDGSLVGYVAAAEKDAEGNITANATKVTFTNTFGVNDDTAFAIGNNVLSVYSEDVTGEATMGARSALLGYAELINVDGSAWVLTKTDGRLTAGLAQFVPEEERFSDNALNELLALNTLNTSISAAKDKGDANYVICISDSDDLYKTYVETLSSEERGFTLKVDNTGTTLNTEGTYNAVLIKDEWVVSVTHVGNSVNETYITINCTGIEVSPHLNGEVEYSTPNDAAVVGYTATEDLNVSFHMLQKCWEYGNGFVIQLKNGHFIVIDGGVEQELPYILDYMDSLCKEGTVPIVEAWVISHVHRDHIGALIELIKYSQEGYAEQGSSGSDTYYGDRLYVEGIYYSEVEQDLVAQEDDTYWAHKYQYNTIIEQASKYLKSTDGTGTKVYRPQAGQRYYFDGVVMDIILTQEQMDITPGDTNTNLQTINDTSTWCMFTVNDGSETGKTILTGGDGYERNMQYLVNAFAADTTYFNVDVMTALHHGSNKYDTFMNLCKVSTVVLFDKSKFNEYSSLLDSQTEEYKNYSALISNASSGYKKSGDGDVALTFENGTITIEQKERATWNYCEKLY